MNRQELEEALDLWMATDWDRSLIDNPDWENRGRVHDWRNHVPYGLMKFWGRLSDETKFVVFALAIEEAHNEVWD